MNVLVISDLHICNGDRLSTFNWNQYDFIQKIETMRATYDINEVVLNGDIYELCKYSLDDITSSNKMLIAYFQRINAVYIKGNHDIAHEQGLDHYLIINSKGQKIYIEHGHRADFINGTRIGRLISTTFFKALRICSNLPLTLRFYFNRLHKDEELREARTYKFYKYLRYALNLLKKYDVIILGHTHKMEAHKTYNFDKKKLYLNSGSCSFGRFQGIVLDTESLEYQAITCTAHQINPLHFIPRKVSGMAWFPHSTPGPHKVANALS